MKRSTLLIVLAVIALSLGSSQAQSLKETTDWIHSFTETHGVWHCQRNPYCTSITSETSHISFDGCIATVIYHETFHDGTDATTTAKANLQHLQPTAKVKREYDNPDGRVIGLYVPTRENKKSVIVKNGKGPLDYLDLDFSSQDDAERVTKALNHAVVLCGGKKDPF